ncbi:hypothetical protein HFP89_01960 [Wenzhouxiangella sp. XN79A]|uniref:hypothetical protein n=1 Tax=Wenzhouxiangella sp. XN79A TaxID=2724193 RepID=UPI00144AB355|nr:hypothetical protein [Wenzhouxiangella sp. XN79A]NKI33929.1 hypothetical protein [Wenzhouxiangella sp. XN79A]
MHSGWPVAARVLTTPGMAREPGALLQAIPGDCAAGVPEHCSCAGFENRSGLATRCTHVRRCPLPVLEGVERPTTFSADGERVDEFQMHDGRLHGVEVRGDRSDRRVQIVARHRGAGDRARTASIRARHGVPASSASASAPQRD